MSGRVHVNDESAWPGTYENNSIIGKRNAAFLRKLDMKNQEVEGDKCVENILQQWLGKGKREEKLK